MSTARAATFRTVHRGATDRHHHAPRIPWAVNPRRTESIFGYRVTRRMYEVGMFLIATAVFMLFMVDFDMDPRVWTPNVIHVYESIAH